MRRRTKGCVGFAALGFAALCAWRVHAVPLLRVEIKVGT
jgi:hypothetical protein